MIEFAKEMSFHEKALCMKSNRDESRVRVFKYPAILAPEFSRNFSPKNPIELRYRIKILLQEKQA